MKKKKILFYDTTLRDGSQMEGISLSLRDKLMIAKRLDRFGMHYLEGGWPGSNPKDMEFFRAIKKAGLRHARVAAFGSTRRPHVKVKDDPQLKALLDAGTKTVTIFGKSWNMHVRDVFKVSLKENLLMIYETVAYLKDKKIEVIYDAEHFFDGFKANPDYAIKSLQQAAKAGADNLSLCDTNGGTLPHEIRRAILRVKRAVKTPLGIHCHNDSELAVANSIQAVGEGCALVQGTINGFGERCGNANLVSIIPNLQLKMGYRCLTNDRIRHLTELSRYISDVANIPPTNQMPFTGASAFAHKAGVHVSAIQKNFSAYEHIDPEIVGNRRRVLVSDLSGKSNIEYKTKEMDIKLGVNGYDSKKIVNEIKRLEDMGYQYEAAEGSLELLIRKAANQFEDPFSLEYLRVTIEKDKTGPTTSQATIKVSVGDEHEITAAEGDGPVNAMDNALRKALTGFFPEIREMKLVDFKGMVIEGTEGTGARVRVRIDSGDAHEVWSTVGVSENIIEASWQALVDSIQYKLLKDKQGNSRHN